MTLVASVVRCRLISFRRGRGRTRSSVSRTCARHLTAKCKAHRAKLPFKICERYNVQIRFVEKVLLLRAYILLRFRVLLWFFSIFFSSLSLLYNMARPIVLLLDAATRASRRCHTATYMIVNFVQVLFVFLLRTSEFFLSLFVILLDQLCTKVACCI